MHFQLNPGDQGSPVTFFRVSYILKGVASVIRVEVRQYVSSECCYQSTILHGVITQNNAI
jgi:hypothetical protein